MFWCYLAAGCWLGFMGWFVGWILVSEVGVFGVDLLGWGLVQPGFLAFVGSIVLLRFAD